MLNKPASSRDSSVEPDRPRRSSRCEKDKGKDKDGKEKDNKDKGAASGSQSGSSGNSRRKPKKTQKVVDTQSVDEASPDEGSDNEDSHKMHVDKEGNMTLDDGTVVVQPEAPDDSTPRAKQAQAQNSKRILGDMEVINCSACNKQMNPNIYGAVRKHPVLKVLICKKCYNWYASDEIEQDSDGMDEQCRWCGEGGNLMCCDYCHNAFCKGCIKRNLGRQALSEITDADEDDKWHCYVCNLKPLSSLIKDANRTMQRIEEVRRKNKESKEKESKEKHDTPKSSKDKGKGGPFKSSKNRSDLDLDRVRSLIPESLLNTFSSKSYESSFPVKGTGSQVNPDTLGFALEKLYEASKAEYGALSSLRSAYQKLKAKTDDEATATKKKMCRQLNNVIHLQKKVYSDTETFISKGRSVSSKGKTSKKAAAAESSDDEAPAQSKVNGVASSKEKKGLKIRINFGPKSKKEVLKDEEDSDEKHDIKEKKNVKKEIKETADEKSQGMSSKKESTKTEIKEEKKVKHEEIKEEISLLESDDEEPEAAGSTDPADVLAILSGCGVVSDSITANMSAEEMEEPSVEADMEDQPANASGMDHLLAEINALNESLELHSGQEGEDMANGVDTSQEEPMEASDGDISDVEPELGSSKPKSSGTKKRTNTNMEAQRQLHKELLEDSSSDDEDDDDSDSDILSSSDDDSEEKSSGEEYRPAEKDKEKRDEKMERRRQRLQERKNRRRKRAKESKIKNVDNSDEAEESADDHKKKKGKDKKKKKGRKDADDKKKKSKKGKQEEDEDRKSKQKKKKKSKKDDSEESDDETDKKSSKKKHDKKAKKSKSDKDKDDDEDSEDEGGKKNVKKTDDKKSKKSKNAKDKEDSEDSGDEKQKTGVKKKNDKISKNDKDTEDSEDEKENTSPKKKGDKKSTKSKGEKDEEGSEASGDENEKTSAKKEDGKKSKKSQEDQDKEDSEESGDETEKTSVKKKDDESKKSKAGKDDGSEISEDENENTSAKKKDDKSKKSKANKGEGTEDSGDEEEKKINKKKNDKKSKKSKSDKDSDGENDDEGCDDKKKTGKGSSKKKSKEAESSEEEEDTKTEKKTSKAKKTRKDTESEDDGDDESEEPDDKVKGKVKKGKRRSSSDDPESEDKKGKAKSADKKKGKGEDKEKTKEKAAKTKNKSQDDESSEDLDKEIDDLEKMPKLRKGKEKEKKEDPEKDETKGKGKRGHVAGTPINRKTTAAERRQKREDLLNQLNSDESEPEVEDDEAEEKDSGDEAELAKVKKKADELTGSDEEKRLALLDDDSGSDVVDEDNSDEDLLPKKEKKAKDKKSTKDESEEDVVNLDTSDSDEDSKKQAKKTKLLREKISDSESDFEEPPKKKKKKKDDSDEDASSGSDSEPVVKKKKGKRKKGDSSEDFVTDSDEDKPKSKRKRVKKNSDSSSEGEKKEDGTDDEDASPSKGRKAIRKILKDKKLGDETKQALKEEEERRERMAERQKMYNEITEEDTSPLKVPVTTKLVLEQDEDNEPVIEVDSRIIKKLKPHQVEAVKFLWDNVAETCERLKTTEGSGCILAHCMGLGKTLSVITLLHTLMLNKKKTGIRRVLCVTPLNTVLNWQCEFEKWIDEEDELEVYELSQVKNNWSRADNLEMWYDGGGVMIVSYEMFRNLTQHRFTKNKKQKKIFTKTLADPGPEMVICDEGHILKNDASAISKAMNLIKTKRRIVLTGTPLQNNLVEYHCMVSFVKPSLLGSRKEFSNMFVNPLVNGQHADSTPYDVRVMQKRAHILHEKLDGCVQRKDYSALMKFLPPKQEYVISVKLSETQVNLYRKFLDLHVTGDGVSGVGGRGTRLFADYQGLMRIWTHPWVLKLEEVRRENNKKYDSDEETEESGDDSFIDDDESEASFTHSDNSVTEISDDDAPSKKKDKKGKKKEKEPEAGPSRRSARGGGGDSDVEIVNEWKTKSRNPESGELDQGTEDKNEEGKTENKITEEWWADYVSEEDHFKTELSGKLTLLSEILRMSESIGDKVLVFSQSLLSLNLIEEYLEQWEKTGKEEAKKEKDKEEENDDEEEDIIPPVAPSQGWSHGLDYFRMDGSTQAHIRQRWAEIFNDPENTRARLFLISTKAGGLGINMVAANRVIIFDASWNPSHDVQSIFRVYRFGQTKPSYVYRFLAQGTMEEKIYSRQVTKQSLSQRVVDEHQIERHFTYADLKALYDFQPAKEPTETPKLPKDLLLAELLANKREWIINYHEHDSLLENKIADNLTEEERKAAWEEFENEKKGILSHAQQLQQQANRGQMGMNFASTQNYMAQQMPGGAYLELARAIYQQNPTLNVTEVYQRVHQYIQMQMASRQQQQLLLQQQMQQARQQQQSQMMAKALQQQAQRSATADDGTTRPALYSLLNHIRSPSEPN